ncbi:histidine phosphatase family protein [Winogradskyella sp. PC-19]|jgi:phosphohistidine phosphatase|uniref:SixA phosphatase family protein n=1 Tax=unclassified Winogradskyella TaxID=2615021 RepID=UPI000B3C105C|nr:MULTISPECIES: histidine phosphatase family protein [unclassified Winogradskyella]ARV08716.1 histidine phosphatase family protein [Winogradskyella sp. PC-19]
MINKKIILVRHGKSSWGHNVSDRNRPLKKRGINDALIISTEFNKKKYKIEKVYSSPAKRAHSTCEIFVNNLGLAKDSISIVDSLYDFSGENVMHFINTLDNSLNTVLIFGHNHAFTSIANTCGDMYIDNLPTSGLVVLNFNIETWEHAKYGQTELVMFPRDFRP